MQSNIKRVSLNSDWYFALENSALDSLSYEEMNIVPDKFYSATVPGTIHTDLLNNNLIEDPFYSDNEKRLQWIANYDWVYQKEFIFNNKDGEKYNLVFDGLDTIADIYLNDTLIGQTKNMFVQYKIAVPNKLKNGKNKLKVLFRSPNKFSEDEEFKYTKLPVALKSSRVYIRKAQYSFGWDWGPVFTTSGIWKDVYLEKINKAEIENVGFNTLSIDGNEAEVEIKTKINKGREANLKLQIKFEHEDQIIQDEMNLNETHDVIKLNIPSPKLWYPNGEGEQNLYNLSLQLLNTENEIVDEKIKIVGIRTIELIDEKEGKPDFAFKINGKVIFCKGANWIPADTFLTRVTDEKYFDLLEKAKNANMNMIRVWGGGIYEKDIFYEYCDQLGLLVWQDFMFACGSYPEHEEFIENIKEEVSQNINRLQYHPSIAIWCGNNENEWGWYQQQDSSYKEMSGYKIYHSVIPKILNELDPKRPYWPSSPFGKEKDPNSQKSGNTHQWDIWSGWIDYGEVKNDKSLFVTEFGFQGPANINTWKKALHKKNRRIQDEIFEFHNKQVEGPERIMKFLSANLPIKTKWKDYLYLSQLNQGLALKTCIEHWRANESTNGSIIWQINDCWPVTSWSIIDSESTPKMSYYFVKNVFKQQVLKFNGRNSCSIFNHSGNDFIGTLKICKISLPDGKIISDNSHELSISANSHQNINLVAPPGMDKEKLVFIGTLHNINGDLINRNYHLDTKWKHTLLPKSELEYSTLNKEGKEFIKIFSHSVSFFIDLYHPNLTFSDRGFIMLPGEELDVSVDNNVNDKVNLKKIKCTTLNNYLSKY